MTNSRTELEEALVAALLISPSELLANAAAVDPQFFREPKLQDVVLALFELAVEGQEMSIANVSAKSGALESTLYEMTMRNSVGAVAILSRALTEFNIRELYDELRRSKEDDAFEILERIGRAHRTMQRMVDVHATKPKAAILAEFRKYCEDGLNQSILRHVPTPFPTLSNWTHDGWPLGNITFVGGGPGAGKTSFAILTAMHAAKCGVQTSYLQGEMPMNEILERAQGIDQRIVIDEISRGRKLMETAEFIEKFERLPLEVHNTFERTAEQLNARCAEAIDGGSKLIVVDYLQIFTEKSDPKKEFSQIKAISENCRKSALQRSVHYVILSSLNRIEAGQKRLTLNSFYGGSQLGHDCAIGIILHSDDEDDEIDVRTRRVHVDVVKNRQGQRGVIDLLYDLPSQQMVEDAGIEVPDRRYERTDGDSF